MHEYGPILGMDGLSNEPEEKPRWSDKLKKLIGIQQRTGTVEPKSYSGKDILDGMKEQKEKNEKAEAERMSKAGV